MELYNPGLPFVYTSAWAPSRAHPRSGQVRPHRGEDWGAPSGTPIPAAGDGKVVFNGSMSGYGYVVVLEHANGAEIVHTLYAHMSTASPLALGSSVTKGTSVGPCGNTGVGTGSHLHFEVLRNGTKGRPNLARGHATVNPRGFDISGLTHPDVEISTNSIAAPVEQPKAVGSSPVISFQYPFRKADGKQFTDANEIYKALESETSGHYLLGSNNFWHGGIHISDKSAPQCVLNEPIRCIADGEVVAYRLNQDYLESTFGENEKKLKYSNSFCLVRHEYNSAPNTEEGLNKGRQNKLTFYSLYMHLLPYEHYPLAPEQNPKPSVTMNVGDYRAYDNAKWVAGTSIYGLIQKGTKLEIIEQASQGSETYAKGKILAGKVRNGSSTTCNVGDEIWFAYKQNDSPWENSAGKKIWTTDHIPERLRPNYWQGKVQATVLKTLNLRQAPAVMEHGHPAGSLIGSIQLIPSSVVEFDSAKVLNLNVGGKIRRMAQCTLVSGGPAGSGAIPPTFWACVENLPDFKMMSWTSLKPSTFNSVVMVNTGIKAGDPIGYLGLMENLTGEDGGICSKHQVHVEVFTADSGINDFLQNTAGLKTGKQYLQLPSGIKLKIKNSSVETSPLKEEHVVELAKVPVVKEAEEDWYEVSLVDDSQNARGLVKKSSAQIITQHDWEKLGFKIVEEANATADGFLDPDDMPQFFKDLLAKIDKNGDGVSPSELAESFKNIKIREQWSKIVACHPTEWKESSSSAKWSRLDLLLRTSPKTLKHEKERIDKLVFWDELSGNAKIGDSTGNVRHFHPLDLVSYMQASNRKCFCFEQGAVDSPCQTGYRDVTKEHFELLATQLGVEREVLRAIAIAETGDKVPFKEFVPGQQHAAILYERHFMYRFLKNKGYTNQELNYLSSSEPKIVHVYERGYSYGSERAQYERLLRARELDSDAANKSCSWGKFQVMGEYYSRLYGSLDELVEAQNYCALQHLQYFKVFLTKEKDMLEPMRRKDWLVIARRYNGAGQIGYDRKISNYYYELKENW